MGVIGFSGSGLDQARTVLRSWRTNKPAWILWPIILNLPIDYWGQEPYQSEFRVPDTVRILRTDSGVSRARSDMMGTDEQTEFPSKILVVDDNDQNRELLVAHVQDLPNVTVISAVDGADALEQVARGHPDLILLDIMMPKMSGFEVCRRLKSDPATRDIPIIMVTALNEIADHEKGIESGCDDFLSKPVNRLELVKRVQSLLRIRRLKSQLDRTMALIKRVPNR